MALEGFRGAKDVQTDVQILCTPVKPDHMVPRTAYTPKKTTRKLTQVMPTHIQYLAPDNTQSLCLENINAHQTTGLIGSNMLLDCFGCQLSTGFRCFLPLELRAMWICDFSSCIISRWSRLIGVIDWRQYTVFLALSFNYGSSRYGAITTIHTHTHISHTPTFHYCPFTLRMTKAEDMSSNAIHLTVLIK